MIRTYFSPLGYYPSRMSTVDDSKCTASFYCACHAFVLLYTAGRTPKHCTELPKAISEGCIEQGLAGAGLVEEVKWSNCGNKSNTVVHSFSVMNTNCLFDLLASLYKRGIPLLVFHLPSFSIQGTNCGQTCCVTSTTCFSCTSDTNSRQLTLSYAHMIECTVVWSIYVAILIYFIIFI